MNILAIGAHPDDVETMCAGTGININSTVEEINQVAANIRQIVLSL